MNTKTTLVLALVAAAAAGYVLLVEKPWVEQAAPVEVKTAAVALFEPKCDDPDRIEIQRYDGKKVVLAKDAEDKSWKMTSPLEVPAREAQMKSIIDKVGDIKFSRKYGSDDSDRPTDKVTGLDKPAAVVRLFKANKEVVNVVIGSRVPTGKGNFIKIGGEVRVKVDGKEQTVNDKDILEARSDSGSSDPVDMSEIFTAKLDTFRDMNVMKYDMNDVKRVKVEGDRNFVLVKNGENWVIESPIRGRADKAKAESVARAMSSLYAADFKDDAPKSLKPYGLDPARIKVTVETETKLPPKAKPGDPNTKPADIEPSTKLVKHVLELGGPTDAGGKQFFARLGDKKWVFAIQEYTSKSIMVDLTELQDKKLATIDTAKVTSVDIMSSEGALKVTKDDKGKWLDGTGKASDTIAVNDLLKSISNLQAANFVDPQKELIKLDWNKPRARVAVTEEGSLTPVVVLVGPASASGKMVFVKNAAEQAVAVVPEDAVASLLAGPMSYRDRTVAKFDRGRVKKVEIAQSGKEPVLLTQTDGAWAMIAPVAAPVERDVIRNLMQNTSRLIAKSVAGSADKAKYGLDAPAVKLAVYVEPEAAKPDAKPAATQPATKPAGIKSAKTTAEKIKQIEQLIEFQKTNAKENPKATEMLRDQLAKLKAQAKTEASGAATKSADDKPADDSTVIRMSLAQKDGKTYAAVEGNELIFEIDNMVFGDAMAEMHERQVTKFENGKINEIEIVSGKTTLTFRRTGEDWKYLVDPVLPIDRDKVNKVLDDLKEMKTHRYVSYTTSDLAKFGLDSPALKISLVPEGGQRIQVLISAKGLETGPDKSVYAAIAGQNKVFLLRPDQAGKFGRKLEDFERGATGGNPNQGGYPGGNPGQGGYPGGNMGGAPRGNFGG